MNANNLRDWIDSLTDDIEFRYQGLFGSICPFNRQNISLCYHGNEVTVHSVDEAMSTPFIDGKSLNDLCDQLDI